jgi:hypothetical protein
MPRLVIFKCEGKARRDVRFIDLRGRKVFLTVASAPFVLIRSIFKNTTATRDKEKNGWMSGSPGHFRRKHKAFCITRKRATH